LPAQRRQEKERLALIAASEKNDRVLTTGGIYGTIVSISDKGGEMLVKVDDKGKIRVTRSSNARNPTREEKAKQAREEQAAGKQRGPAGFCRLRLCKAASGDHRKGIPSEYENAQETTYDLPVAHRPRAVHHRSRLLELHPGADRSFRQAGDPANV